MDEFTMIYLVFFSLGLILSVVNFITVFCLTDRFRKNTLSHYFPIVLSIPITILLSIALVIKMNNSTRVGEYILQLALMVVPISSIALLLVAGFLKPIEGNYQISMWKIIVSISVVLIYILQMIWLWLDWEFMNVMSKFITISIVAVTFLGTAHLAQSINYKGKEISKTKKIISIVAFLVVHFFIIRLAFFW